MNKMQFKLTGKLCCLPCAFGVDPVRYKYLMDAIIYSMRVGKDRGDSAMQIVAEVSQYCESPAELVFVTQGLLGLFEKINNEKHSALSQSPHLN